MKANLVGISFYVLFSTKVDEFITGTKIMIALTNELSGKRY